MRADGKVSDLFEAILSNNMRAVEQLWNSDIEFRGATISGMNPLHFAVLHQKYELASFFLRSGLDPNLRISLNSERISDYTCVHICTATKDFDFFYRFLPMLLEYGADINAVDGEGNSAIHIASEFSNSNFVVELLKYGANPNAVLLSGIAPIHLAVASNRIEIAEALLKNGANPDVYSETCLPALHAALKLKLFKMTDTLLYAKCNPNLRNAEGVPPIHYAVVANWVEGVELLLSNHADINCPDKEGRTAIVFAKLLKLKKIETYLLKNGAVSPDSSLVTSAQKSMDSLNEFREVASPQLPEYVWRSIYLLSVKVAAVVFVATHTVIIFPKVTGREIGGFIGTDMGGYFFDLGVVSKILSAMFCAMTPIYGTIMAYKIAFQEWGFGWFFSSIILFGPLFLPIIWALAEAWLRRKDRNNAVVES